MPQHKCGFEIKSVDGREVVQFGNQRLLEAVSKALAGSRPADSILERHNIPLNDLIKYLPELEAYENQNVFRDLLDTLERERMKVAPSLATNLKTAQITYADYHWLLRAGDLLVTQRDKKPQCLIFEYYEECPGILELFCRRLMFNGENYGFVQVKITLQEFFLVECITELDIFPLRYHKDRRSIYQELVKRSTAYKSAWKTSWYYRGPSFFRGSWKQLDREIYVSYGIQKPLFSGSIVLDPKQDDLITCPSTVPGQDLASDLLVDLDIACLTPMTYSSSIELKDFLHPEEASLLQTFASLEKEVVIVTLCGLESTEMVARELANRRQRPLVVHGNAQNLETRVSEARYKETDILIRGTDVAKYELKAILGDRCILLVDTCSDDPRPEFPSPVVVLRYLNTFDRKIVWTYFAGDRLSREEIDHFSQTKMTMLQIQNAVQILVAQPESAREKCLESLSKFQGVATPPPESFDQSSTKWVETLLPGLLRERRGPQDTHPLMLSGNLGPEFSLTLTNVTGVEIQILARVVHELPQETLPYENLTYDQKSTGQDATVVLESSTAWQILPATGPNQQTFDRATETVRKALASTETSTWPPHYLPRKRGQFWSRQCIQLVLHIKRNANSLLDTGLEALKVRLFMTKSWYIPKDVLAETNLRLGKNLVPWQQLQKMAKDENVPKFVNRLLKCAMYPIQVEQYTKFLNGIEKLFEKTDGGERLEPGQALAAMIVLHLLVATTQVATLQFANATEKEFAGRRQCRQAAEAAIFGMEEMLNQIRDLYEERYQEQDSSSYVAEEFLRLKKEYYTETVQPEYNLADENVFMACNHDRQLSKLLECVQNQKSPLDGVDLTSSTAHQSETASSLRLTTKSFDDSASSMEEETDGGSISGTTIED